MIESQWNPWSINRYDWWAWILHFQADVAREYWLRVFTDLPQYKQYRVSVLRKKINPKTWKKRTLWQIYKKHAEILKSKWIDDNQMSINELEKFDERFNADKCINAACKYIKIIRKKYVDQYYEQKTKHKSRNKYKKNEEDFKRILSANWFNKWPSRFTVNFEEWSHISNFIENKEYLENYESRLKELLKQWLTWDQILEQLQYPFYNSTISNPEEWWEYFKYNWINTTQDKISSDFDDRDSTYENNKYKNTWYANIIKEWNQIYIKAKSNQKSEINYKYKETSKNKGPFEYIRISNNKKYKVYSYTIKNWWNYGWVLKQFSKNNWTIEWSIVTDQNWKEYPRNKEFQKGEIIYIKEKIN